MFTHRWFCFALSLLLIGTIFAQDNGGKLPRRFDDANEVDDDDDRAPPVNEVKPAAAPAPTPAPFLRVLPTNPPRVEQRRPPPTPLASSIECKDDVQKYCSKGVNKLLPNLKVLQCVDDLDNVR